MFIDVRCDCGYRVRADFDKVLWLKDYAKKICKCHQEYCKLCCHQVKECGHCKDLFCKMCSDTESETESEKYCDGCKANQETEDKVKRQVEENNQ